MINLALCTPTGASGNHFVLSTKKGKSETQELNIHLGSQDGLIPGFLLQGPFGPFPTSRIIWGLREKRV